MSLGAPKAGPDPQRGMAAQRQLRKPVLAERRGRWLGNAWTDLHCLKEEMGFPVPVVAMSPLHIAVLEWDLECPCCFFSSLLQGPGCSLQPQAVVVRLGAKQGVGDRENQILPSFPAMGMPSAFLKKTR